MNQLAALGVENKPINALGAFREGAATAAGLDQAKKEAAQQAMGMIGSIALGAMGGDMNGQADPKLYEEGLGILEGYGIDVAPFRGKPQLAPVAARASLTTMQQIANARDEQSMDLALEKFERDIMESDRSYGLQREELDINRQKLNAPAGPQSTLGKLAADRAAGLITPQEYDAAVAKATQSSNGITVDADGNIQIGGPSQAQFGKQSGKNDADLIKEARDTAATAQELRSLAAQMETVAPNVGYTGPGGGMYGAVDDAIGVLPGDKGARGAFRQLSMESQLAMTQKTKGAITDREMGMFKQAVPGLTQTSDGNKAMVNIMKATARRLEERASFFEQYQARTGGLNGATEAWGKYLADNPLIVSSEAGGVALSGDVKSYETYLPQGGAGQSPAPATGGEITSQEQYDALPSGSEFMSNGKRYRKP